MTERRTTERPLRLAMIVGTTREGRFGPEAAHRVAASIRERNDVVVDLVDLAGLALPDVLTDEPPQVVVELGARLAAADGFVVVTAEYNHSFPAPLKTAIDWFHEEWRAKPVGHVSYGGISGGLRAVEQLRLVFEELHAVSMRTSVAFPNYWDSLDAEGGLVVGKPGESAISEMVDQLVWWGEALRRHRGEVAYPGGDA